jgi:hypothetical protein
MEAFDEAKGPGCGRDTGLGHIVRDGVSQRHVRL